MMDKNRFPMSQTSEIERLKKENHTLRTLEQQYRQFFEKSPIMIYVTDHEGFFLRVNQAGAEMMGYDDPDDILGTHFRDHFFKDKKEFSEYEERIREHGIIIEFETVLKKRCGQVLAVNLIGAARTTPGNEHNGYEGVALDITDRIEADRIIKESEEKYKTILDNSLAGIYMFQDGGHFSYVNRRMLSILGYGGPEELIGRKFWEIVAPEDRELVKQRGLQREKSKIEPRQYPFRMLRKDGSVVWIDMRSSHASYMGTPAVVGNFIDISKEKKAREEIRNLSHKLIEGIEEERRSLASDLHDEFGQALTLIQFDIESLQRVLPATLKEANGISVKIMDQIQNLAEKVRNTTARLRPELLDYLGLVPTLKWYVDDFRKRFREIAIDFEAIGFKRRLSPAVEIVIYRIFQEGLNNVTKHADATRVEVRLTASHPRVIFMMQDNGKGFEQQENGMPREGLSLGIGLLSMKERVASLKGSIRIKSVLNKGTAIRVEFPVG